MRDVLTHAWTTLGLDGAVGGDEAFKQMVLARLVEPTRRAYTVRVIASLGITGLTVPTVFCSLARCVERDWRTSIQAALHAQVAVCGDLSLLMHDVTTLYFEAEKEDDLRKVGFSKERRVDPQITVGMLADRTGFPLQVGCWEANHAETRTIVPMVQDFLDAHGVSAADLVVADAGMMSYTNLTALDEAGCSFIVGSKTTKAPHDLVEHTHFHGDAYPGGALIETTTPTRGTKSAPAGAPKVKNRPRLGPRQRPEIMAGGVALLRTALRPRQPHSHRAGEQDQAVTDRDTSSRRPRFVKGSRGDLSLDKTALSRARAAAGIKGYVTNMTATQMGAAETVASYRSLWHVEQSRRMSKHDPKARPVFHHQRNSSEAHLTTIMAALAVAHYLQDATGTSIKRIIHTLQPLQSVEAPIAKYTITAQPQLTAEAADIITAVRLRGH